MDATPSTLARSPSRAQPHRTRPRRAGRALALATIATLTLLLAACGTKEQEDVVDGQSNIIPDVTPSGDAVVPQGLEAGRLTIEDGRFGTDQLVLQQDQPTILRVVNEDGQAYRLEIASLVGATAIAASGETTVEFTDPVAGAFEGHLLPQSGADVLDRIQVIVQRPDGGT